MIYSKSNPVGLDVKINSLQTKLNATLVACGISTSDIDIYPRIYKLKEGTMIEPVKFISKEYDKSLFTTDKKVVAYFYERVPVNNENGMFNAVIGNVVHVNLASVYTSITHRADQEFIKVMTDFYRIEPYGFRLTSISTGELVYSDFNFEETKENIHPYFSVRFDLNINFRI